LLFPYIHSHLKCNSCPKQELQVVYEDDHIVVVDKPSGVLCVPSAQAIPSLAQTVFETVEHSLSSYDRMVVHRLGMETSGIVIFAKTMDALRGMNSLFRTRSITRQYEVLVCGHVKDDAGSIDLPLMRDYEFPPYMRISTDEHQQALADLDSAIVGKKLLGAPKDSRTEYEVVAREELGHAKLPVTRLTVTSVTGRTHQLNVHCAAFGHPIVSDRVYGLGGDAAPNGGLESVSRGSENAVTAEMEHKIAEASADQAMCVHAKRLSFRHPVTQQEVDFESAPPF
jgi:tRNA pseudouridine32 synthase/23S rRNA pseudouridine746 synthase